MNLPTLIAGLILALIVVAMIKSAKKDKNNSCDGCSCSCNCCNMKDQCNKNANTE